ncbi:MAG TPA: hypothetical protein VGB30_11365 [bacterium]|jgi:hypothetical protein
MRKFATSMVLFSLLAATMAYADPVDLINASSDDIGSGVKGYSLDASWHIVDPWGESDFALGAAAALNVALSLYFDGHASREQIQLQRRMIEDRDYESIQWAGFASDVLGELKTDYPEAFPEDIELKPFDLSPSEPPHISGDNPHIVVVRYDDEEYLERLLQRLYFKLIQGPVLLTVPYSGDSELVPAEYRNWNNFEYASRDDTMVWDDIRLVYVDWNLTRTVVLMYEDGLIACYDSGKKYYIDHTSAVVEAGAMLAHPDFENLSTDGATSFLLTTVDDE